MGTLSQDGLNNDFYSGSRIALRGELPGFHLLKSRDQHLFHYGVVSAKQHHLSLIVGSFYSTQHFIFFELFPHRVRNGTRSGRAGMAHSEQVICIFIDSGFQFRHSMSGLALRGRNSPLCLLNIRMMHRLLRVSTGGSIVACQ